MKSTIIEVIFYVRDSDGPPIGRALRAAGGSNWSCVIIGKNAQSQIRTSLPRLKQVREWFRDQTGRVNLRQANIWRIEEAPNA